MGQAKRRGSFEDRVQQAQDRRAAEIEAARLLEQERKAKLQAEWDALPQEEKDRIIASHRRRKAKRLSPLAAVALILGASYFP